MFNSTSATQSQSLFTSNLISGVESNPVHDIRQPIVGELVFDKFIKTEDEDSPLLLDDMTPSTTTTSLGNAVDDFFFEDDNSTPMFEFEKPDPSNQWTSLFDDDIPITQKDVQLVSDMGIQIGSIENGNENKVETNDSLTISQNSFLPTPTIEEGKLIKSKSSPKLNGRENKVSKVDHLGVVSYNRKNRTAPLSPIVVESSDPVATKRARNTEAARRSRARKLLRMNQLEEKVEELLNKNTQLENEIKRLTSLLNK